MSWQDTARTLLLTENDALARYRDRVAAVLSLPAGLLLAALSINNFAQGRTVMGLVTGLVVFILLGNYWSIQRRGKALVDYAFILLPGWVGVLSALKMQGVLASFWAFPMMLIAYFVVPRFQALLYSLLVLVSVPWAVAEWIDPAIALRLVASLVLTLLMIQVILNVLVDLQAQLLQQSRTDALTGVFNRRHLDEVLSLAAVQATRHRPQRALLVLDVDHFKRINDQRGHGDGDETLRALVRVLRQRLRRSDRLFRMGGEEFVVLLDDTGMDEALNLAEALRLRVESETLLPNWRVTVSVGVSEQRSGESAEAWLARADQALYRAKNNGRNRVESEGATFAPPAAQRP
jgi:diguanylate cyclase (GGDEF)-like protein